MLQDGTKRFLWVTVLACLVAAGAMFVFHTFGQQKFDPIWVGVTSMAVVYVWSLLTVRY